MCVCEREREREEREIRLTERQKNKENKLIDRQTVRVTERVYKKETRCKMTLLAHIMKTIQLFSSFLHNK